MTIEFTVYGVPQPKGSGSKTKAGVYIEAGTKDRKAEDGSKIIGTRSLKRLWANTVCEAAKGLVSAPLDGPIFFGAMYYFAAPRAGKVAKRLWHDVTPDLDKLIRATWDPLKRAGLIADDARIVKIVWAQKRTIQDASMPRAEITIGRLYDGP